MIGKTSKFRTFRSVSPMKSFTLDVRALRSFLAILELGSLTAAARRVHRSQSAVSQQLATLEAQLGRPLFRREKRRLLPTDFGREFARRARELVVLHDSLLDRLDPRVVRGRLRFGTPDLYAAYLLPKVLARFAAAYPRVELDLHCARSPLLLERLRRGELDLVLATGQFGDRSGRLLRYEPLVWVAATGVRFPDDQPLPVALLPEGAVYTHHARVALERAGRAWRFACTSESIAGLQAAVLAGLAVSVVPACAVVEGTEVLGPADGLPGLPAVRLVLHDRGEPLSSPVERFAAFVAEALAPSGGEPVAQEER